MGLSYYPLENNIKTIETLIYVMKDKAKKPLIPPPPITGESLIDDDEIEDLIDRACQ